MNDLLGSESAPFIIGIALALIALAVVLWPMFTDHVTAEVRPEHRRAPKLEVDDEPEAGSAIEALREIEFDQATGKLSDDDYAGLKERYTAQALIELRARDAASTAVTGAPRDAAAAIAEQLVRKYRPGSTICPTHGLRPEPDALFCSECGVYLPGKCDRCGTSVLAVGAHFCSGCGHALAA
jgi:hypothetical protein